jgi:hypothetical protein
MDPHRAIRPASTERDVSIEIGDVALDGTVALPWNAAGF